MDKRKVEWRKREKEMEKKRVHLIAVQTHSGLYIRTDLIDQGTKTGKFGKASHFRCLDGDG